MKRLAFLLAFLPTVAFAQVGPEVYKIATTAQVLGFNSSASVAITQAIVSRIVRLTCSVSCYFWVNVSGQSLPATTTTGVYLPSDVPSTYSVSPGSVIYVIGATTTGNLHVQELTK